MIDEKYRKYYTAEELDLNQQLLDECTKPHPNFAHIEDLLQQGADPLGVSMQEECVYSQIIACREDWGHSYLPQMTEMFLRYGMDIDNPRVPFDKLDRCNPFEYFALGVDDNIIESMALLLDSGVSAESAENFWNMGISDLIYCDSAIPQEDEECNERYTNLMKGIMFCASYKHIIDNNDSIRKIIDYAKNDFDVKKFRKWNDFEYKLYGVREDPIVMKNLNIQIYEKSSGQKVWEFNEGDYEKL